MITFHPSLGYTQRADAVSKNGWCRLNNVAARWDKPVTRATTPGLQRVMMMGDSYTHGFGLRQEDVWTSQLANMSPGLEPLNFGVSGYSIAQAYLRFQELRPQMDYDTVVLSIVPRADFWRDINVIRTAVFPDWRMDMPMPRAVIKDEALSFVHQHYESIEAFRADNSAGISDTLREHLEAYDRFYFDSLYEDTPVIGNSMIYKTIVRVLAKFRRTALLKQYRDPQSEAANITHAIMTAMQSDAEADGARFVAFLLPMEHEIDDLQSDAEYSRDWQKLSERLCQGIETCVDLAPHLTALPAECIDTAATNSHYGPKLSRAFAYLAQGVLDPEISEARVPEGQCNPLSVENWRHLIGRCRCPA